MTDLEDFAPGIYHEVEEILKEIFHRVPWGQEIALSSGRKGVIKKFTEPKIKRHGENEGRWYFSFDVIFEHGAPDHIEFTIYHTGGGFGGALAEAIAVPEK